MINSNEAELIGMHTGDGTLYLSGKTRVWEMRGSIHEQEYYTYVAEIIRNILQIELKPKFRGPNSYGIQTTNKTLTQFFIEKGFKPGKKVYTVRIPDYIKLGEVEIKRSFIRGLFDADCCIYFDKNKTSFNYYPRIEFNSASHNLITDLINLLKELGFRLHFWNSGTCKSLCLSGFQNLDKWMEEIKPANSKHILRFQKGIANKSKINLKKKSINLKSPLSSINLSPDGTAVTARGCYS